MAWVSMAGAACGAGGGGGGGQVAQGAGPALAMGPAAPGPHPCGINLGAGMAGGFSWISHDTRRVCSVNESCVKWEICK